MCGHFKTRIEEHIKKHITYKSIKASAKTKSIKANIHTTTTCFDWYNSLYFKIFDKANSKFELRIKEALHINWTKPNLKAEQNHLTLTLSL